jgi:hypothetical protein
MPDNLTVSVSDQLFHAGATPNSKTISVGDQLFHAWITDTSITVKGIRLVLALLAVISAGTLRARIMVRNLLAVQDG